MDTIERRKEGKNFTIISNDVFKAGLSCRAMGLLTFILHLPDDWVLFKTYLYKTLPEGKDAINTAWDELSKKGFIYQKKIPGKNGKLPEIRYYVSDSVKKRAENPHEFISPDADFPQPETRQPENPHLLNTNKQNTNKPIPLFTSVNNGPPQKKAKKKTPAKPVPELKEKTLFQKFVDVYDRWYKEYNDGVPPAFNGAEGNAVKALVAYFKKVGSAKAEKDGIVLDDLGVDSRALSGWEYIFLNWDRLDDFLRGKTRLIDIHSNISNIITQIKNGHSKSKQQKPATGGGVNMADIARAIKSVHR